MGPWWFRLPKPTREEFRTGTHFEARGRNAFKEEITDPPISHGGAFPHKAEGFYEIKVTFTFVPPAQAEQSASERTDVPAAGGGVPGADLALTVRGAPQ